MCQPREHLDLTTKALMTKRRAEVGVEDLHRDLSVVLNIVREMDGCHPATPELALEPVFIRERRG